MTYVCSRNTKADHRIPCTWRLHPRLLTLASPCFSGGGSRILQLLFFTVRSSTANPNFSLPGSATIRPQAQPFSRATKSPLRPTAAGMIRANRVPKDGPFDMGRARELREKRSKSIDLDFVPGIDRHGITLFELLRRKSTNADTSSTRCRRTNLPLDNEERVCSLGLHQGTQATPASACECAGGGR